MSAMNTGLRCYQFQYILVGCEVDAAGGNDKNSRGGWLNLLNLGVLIQRCIQLGAPLHSAVPCCLDRFSSAKMPHEIHRVPASGVF